MEKMKKMAAKCGKMRENGGGWGILRNCQNDAGVVGKVERMCEIGGNGKKIGGKWDNVGQCHFFPIVFFSIFHRLAAFPSCSFDEFVEPN